MATEAAAPLLSGLLEEPQDKLQLLREVPGRLQLLSFHTSSSLPLDFVDLLRSFFRTMWNGILTLATAFFVSTSLLQTKTGYGGGMQMVAGQGQYLLGLDIGMGDTGVRRSIISQLSTLYPGVYTKDNVAFVATHSHAGVGGYVENLLPQITSLGYVKETADAIVAGTVRAVQRAHLSLAPGRLRLGNATVPDANINRSPTAYLANPAAERARYQYDVDKDMTVLRFDDENGRARGLLSFFPVHGTSLYINNTLVSTDNKGMAAFLYENSVEPNAMPGNTSFVAGFTQCEYYPSLPRS
ncbi:hypothetical protein EST38_g5124 [Candolleomyces aberdarensis]|uniref:Neutral/alkaline non-lysosomal ceramidase N-terminal domain-containing protein n=1 Tax=Candolleomyces aberdarensis TaxID=2316362 RepID=A0A4Q2DLA1_9AGAR|nr:hypothetical protein EST38_g5124 [Candolleomyces aberdarensis]